MNYFEGAGDWRLFGGHLSSILQSLERELPARGVDVLVLGAGELSYFYEDDQAKPFRSDASFRYLCPAQGPGHILIIRPSKKPELVLHRPRDFWHAPEPEPESEWAQHFEIRQAETHEGVWDFTRSLKGVVAFVGSQTERARYHGWNVNPFPVVSLLNWLRSFKSPFEISCMEEANRRAIKGHEAAKVAFLDGQSEFEIHLAFLSATAQLERDLPYESIVALGPHAAILHYQHKSRHPQTAEKSEVLLIDAGVTVRGYHSDVTRTWMRHGGVSQASHDFASLIAAVEQLQKDLCAQVRPGVRFTDLQLAMQRGVAEILIGHGLVRGVSADSQEALEIARHFIPHGVGHLLGLFVHDVAGKQASSFGEPLVEGAVPFLRSLRTLEANMILTVEPGLYFIQQKLDELQLNSGLRSHVVWEKVSALKVYGGVRIEDNLQVTPDGSRNLTRP